MRIAKDSDGYWWRVFDDGTWSMCPTNSDNSAVPQPVTYYVPEAELKVTQQREARLREALKQIESSIAPDDMSEGAWRQHLARKALSDIGIGPIRGNEAEAWCSVCGQGISEAYGLLFWRKPEGGIKVSGHWKNARWDGRDVQIGEVVHDCSPTVPVEVAQDETSHSVQM